MKKYNYIKVIQFACNGWEDVCTYEAIDVANAKKDLREYRDSNTGAYRLISRRVINN